MQQADVTEGGKDVSIISRFEKRALWYNERVGAKDLFAVNLEDKTQNTVRGRVLRAEVNW